MGDGVVGSKLVLLINDYLNSHRYTCTDDGLLLLVGSILPSLSVYLTLIFFMLLLAFVLVSRNTYDQMKAENEFPWYVLFGFVIGAISLFVALQFVIGM